MSIVLGIDTGGTFTDAVILDLETKEIYATAKAETTHFHLIDGIGRAIDALSYEDFAKVEYAALSTTLATNAIVEGRGCRVGALIMGFTPQQELPRCEVALLPGAVDLHGTIIEEIDEKQLLAALEGFRGKVDAVAVSCILSVRNPVLEEKVKSMVRDVLGLPCIAAHELSSALGMHERTVTAILNARLLSVIDDLMAAVKAALAAKNMRIPVMIVKGDGSLMTEAIAKDRPIETILSGPAASIIGATFLRGVEDGFIVDIGGTTTDIAVMRGGRPRLDPEGARVGGWRTRVAAAEVNTFGLGGDSRIHLDAFDCKVKVGPRRVYPVSAVAKEYPHYLVELKQIASKRIGIMRYDLCEGLIWLRDAAKGTALSTEQSAVVRAVREKPHTFYELSQILKIDADFINVEYLLEHGIVAMVGFTPTDLLHVTGEYIHGNAAAAKVALTLLAKRWDCSEDEAIDSMRYHITERLSQTILDSSLSYQRIPTDATDSEEVKALIHKAFYPQDEELMSLLFRLNMPVVGIGAPVRSWLAPAAEKFHTSVIYPDHYDVANAIGAAAGKVMHIYHIMVQNHEIDGIHIYAPWGRKTFGAAEDADHNVNDVTAEQAHIANQHKDRHYLTEYAVEYAIRSGKERMQQEMETENVKNYEILVERRDKKVHHGYSENILMFIESEIEIIAVTNPAWES